MTNDDRDTVVERDFDTAKIAPASWRRWHDWVNLLIGAWAIAAPYLFTVSENYRMAGTWLGVGIVIVALWALAKPTSKAAEYTMIALGALLALSPLIDFETNFGVWNAIISGVLVLILAAMALSTIHKVLVREDVRVPRR